MKKAVLTIAVATAMVASLAAWKSNTTGSDASGSGSAPGASALKDAKGVTNITVWHGLGAANGVAFNKLISQFNTENKGKINVSATYQGAYADLLAKYTASLRSNSAPTIVLAGDIATGYMTDVKQSISAASMAKANPGDVKLNDLSAPARNYYTVNGVEQAVPMNVSTPMLWVNMDLLTKASITDLSSLSTVDGMVAAAKAVAAKTGQKGFTMPDDDYYIEQLAATAGQAFCSPDNGRSGKAATGITISSGAAKTAVSKLVSLYTSGVAVDGSPDGSAGVSAFTAGKVGVMLNGSGLLGVLKAGVPFQYEALPYPTSGSSSKAGPVTGGSAMWLSKSATKAQQVAGWKLETFLTSPTSQEQFSQATGYTPINNKTGDLASQKKFLATSAPTQAFLKQVKNTPVNTVTAGCVTGAMTNIRTANVNQLQSAFAGMKSVDSALSAMTASAQTAIAQYRQQLGQ